ncbi:hypothetical protein N7492_004699 [Penicillium capsulatum]|uniref:Uncharacterized protein n=1 Tax=Penicillium capsulatum TaxID=69766 RepID=A0A9W9LQZ5_9EURO|nr:hypothetical protein N7492_004699 [Penicillium capsulatum]
MAEEISHSLLDLYGVSHSSLEPQNSFGRGAHWLHESPFLPVGWETTNASGTASLKHTAMRVLMKDQSLLRSEMFENVPWLVAKFIWEKVYECKKRTLWLWKIFAISYPQFCHEAPTYTLMACRPKQPLNQYLELMNNKDCAWGAVLIVDPGITDVSGLVAIANIKNLMGLEISAHNRGRLYAEYQDAHQGNLEESVARSWMDMVPNGCLQHLRILRLAHQHRITPNILWMLRKLPALELIVMYDCPNITQDGPKSRPPESKRRKREIQSSHGLRIHGWRGFSLDRVPMEIYTEGSLRPLGSLLEMCRADVRESAGSLSSPTDHDQPKSCTSSAKLPFMSFELRENEKYCDYFALESEHRSIYVFRRDNQPSLTRAPAAEAAPGNRQKRRKGDPRDLSDVLGEFLG